MGEGCRVLIAFMGTPLRGDDAAGLLAAQELRSIAGDDPCILECPYGVELCAHRIREEKPQLLIVVDAALGIEPGTIAWADEPPGSWAPTTHSIPPKSLHHYLQSLAGRVKYLLLGVKNVGLGEEPTREARQAARKAAQTLAQILRQNN